MSVAPQEDFGGFVAARWADLEAVAVVAVLDPGPARETTTAALVALRSRWPAALEEGAPTTAARRELLGRLARPTRRRGGEPPEPSPLLREAAEDPDSAVPTALFDGLASEPALVRAAVAARVVWDVGPDTVAALAGRAGADLAADVTAMTHRLLDAHRAARATDGLGPADHRLDDDLADLVQRLAGAAPEPPDPSAVVAGRSRRVRRRSVLAGGAVAAAAGAAGWAAFGGDRGAATAGPAPSSTPTPAGPDDPAWATTSRWPPRGTLVTDFAIQALVVRSAPGARLLYADEVHGVRVVVATDPSVDVGGGPGTTVRAWSGPAGLPAEQLTEVTLGYPGIFGAEDVVALAVEHPTGAVVLALTRPTVARAQVSAVVRPTPAGSIERDWTSVPLEAGVGALHLEPAPGSATRFRCGTYDGPLPRPEAWDVQWGEEGARVESVRTQIANALGIAADRLAVDVLRAVVPPRSTGSAGAAGDQTTTAELVTARTPDGAVVRSILVSTASQGSSSWFGAEPTVVPAADAATPAVFPMSDTSGAPFYVVVVPGAGATVRLSSPTTGAESDAVPLTDHAAVVTLPGDYPGDVNVRVEDSDGRAVYGASPPAGRWLYDLWDAQY